MKPLSHINVASTPRFAVWHDEVVQGSLTRDYFYVSKPDAVLVLAHDSTKLILLDVDRYLIGTNLEIPGGRLEGNELPAQAAERELLEECGLKASQLQHAATIYPLPSVVTEKVHIFFAKVTDVTKAVITGEAAIENIRHIHPVSFTEAKRAAMAGQIKCSVDAYAVFLFLEGRTK
jgi:8-oxo-dGTP pyrophosphatase MutT (NUDIX family)